jgi:hypothetical protein
MRPGRASQAAMMTITKLKISFPMWAYASTNVFGAVGQVYVDYPGTDVFLW